MYTVDINCDVGEGMLEDIKIAPFVSSFNVACGFHAGDTKTIVETLLIAKKFNIKVGAHPSYPDRENFGRSNITLKKEELVECILYQLGAIEKIATYHGIIINHIKPHGAMYNFICANEEYSFFLVNALRKLNISMFLVALSNSRLVHICRKLNYPVIEEVFADRAYNDDGSLTSRSLQESVIHDVEQIARRVLSMVKQGEVYSINNKKIAIKADTICIHGDTPSAFAIAKAVNTTLKKEAVSIQPPGISC